VLPQLVRSQGGSAAGRDGPLMCTPLPAFLQEEVRLAELQELGETLRELEASHGAAMHVFKGSLASQVCVGVGGMLCKHASAQMPLLAFAADSNACRRCGASGLCHLSACVCGVPY